MNGKLVMASNLFRGEPTIRIWTPLKMFGLLWKLSYGVWNLSFRISRAQFEIFGTKFRVNWCPIWTSRCQNVFRNAFWTQVSRQNIDIMVVFVFSVRCIACEFTLDERRLLIRQCITPGFLQMIVWSDDDWLMKLIKNCSDYLNCHRTRHRWTFSERASVLWFLILLLLLRLEWLRYSSDDHPVLGMLIRGNNCTSNTNDQKLRTQRAHNEGLMTIVITLFHQHYVVWNYLSFSNLGGKFAHIARQAVLNDFYTSNAEHLPYCVCLVQGDQLVGFFFEKLELVRLSSYFSSESLFPVYFSEISEI